MILTMEAKDQRETLLASAKSWRRRKDALTTERDPLVKAMLDGRLFTKEEVHQILGLGRTTIDRIAGPLN